MDPAFLRRAINDMVATTDADETSGVRVDKPIRWPAKIAKAISGFVAGFAFGQ